MMPEELYLREIEAKKREERFPYIIILTLIFLLMTMSGMI